MNILQLTLWYTISPPKISPLWKDNTISCFLPCSQQDAQEILIYLLEGLHEDLNRCKKKKKRVIDCDDGVVTTPPAQLADRAWKHYQDVDNSHIVGECTRNDRSLCV